MQTFWKAKAELYLYNFRKPTWGRVGQGMENKLFLKDSKLIWKGLWCITLVAIRLFRTSSDSDHFAHSKMMLKLLGLSEPVSSSWDKDTNNNLIYICCKNLMRIECTSISLTWNKLRCRYYNCIAIGVDISIHVYIDSNDHVGMGLLLVLILVLVLVLILLLVLMSASVPVLVLVCVLLLGLMMVSILASVLVLISQHGAAWRQLLE